MTHVITRRDALALGAGLGALGLTAVPAMAQQRFFRIGTGGTGGTYYPVGGMIANAISTDKINVSAVATNGSVANVNGIVGGSMESGFSQADINCLGLHRHRHLRGQAQGRGAARHRQSLSRERARRRQEGRRHQVGRRPQGQARLARRAGLGHARQCARDARRLRRDREGHQARVPEAGSSAPRSSRTARSTPTSRPPAIRRAR